ncbi:MAG: hypothetical protein DSY84_03355, partial [Candidatus Neomarinimicrobiota bacterium]
MAWKTKVGQTTASSRQGAMMEYRFRGSTVATALAAATVGAVISVAVTGTAGQGQAPRSAETPDGRPNFNGVWQANNEAHWDLEAHEARAGMVMQQGVYPYEFSTVPAAPVVARGAAGGGAGAGGGGGGGRGGPGG